MLIKITKSCSNGCIHCCNEAEKCNDHMTMETFKDTLEFIKKYDDNHGHIFAGGEPTENPLFFEFIDEFYNIFDKTKNILTICTNGHFMAENQEVMIEYLNKYPYLLVQVTYDDRYYPKKLNTTKKVFHHKNVTVDRVSYLRPQGRAIKNSLKIEKYYPPACINVKLMTLQLKTNELKNIFRTLRQANKECIPCIHFDGTIGFGELDSCPKKVSIYDDETKIIDEFAHLDYKCCPVEYEHTPNDINLMVKKLEDSYVKRNGFR